MQRHTLLVEVSYEGHAFHGVARQPGLLTVGETLQTRLSSVFGQPPRALTFAARTDKGVSAEQNFATCWFRGITPTPEQLRELLYQGPNFRISRAQWVAREVNARNTAAEKHYRYVIETGCIQDESTASTLDPPCDEFWSSPAHRRWRVAPRLDVTAMQRAARDLEGTHDFSAFRAVSCEGKDPHKTLSQVTVQMYGNTLVIDVRGRAFLRKMVRIVVGTLAEVGAGFRPADSLSTLLASGDRHQAGMTAPACGLCLVSVRLAGVPNVDEHFERQRSEKVWHNAAHGDRE